MLGVILARDLAEMSQARLLRHMRQMDDLWVAWGRPADDKMPRNFRLEVDAVRAELLRRGIQGTLF
jgi:hypothetical protein